MPDSTVLIRTLADVLSDLEHATDLAPDRRRDLKSAIQRIAALVERDPCRIPANPAQLRRLLETINPARIGLSAKTIQNVKSNLLAALKVTGVTAPRSTSLSPQWRALYDRLPDRTSRTGLGRFMRFCGAEGIHPEAVDDAVVESFISWLQTNTFARKPNDNHRRACRLWNMAADSVVGWPQRRLTVPSFREPRRTLRLSAFPDSFQREVRRYRNWLESPDPFDDERPHKPLKATTIRNRMAQIEMAASAWASHDGNPEDLTSLKVLVSVEGFKVILRHYLQRNQPPGAAFLHGLAQILYTIAKEWVRVDQAHLDELRRLWRKLPPIPPGLTAKNRELLRHFDDPETRARLLRLPAQLMKLAEKAGPGTEKAMVLAQLAVAIELLLMAPVRMVNLIAIRVGHELKRLGGPDSSYRLVFEADQVKNAEPLEFELPIELCTMIDR